MLSPTVPSAVCHTVSAPPAPGASAGRRLLGQQENGWSGPRGGRAQKSLLLLPRHAVS